MSDNRARIYGASDDLVEFDGAIYGEACLGEGDRSKITLKAPDGTKVRLVAEFCGSANPDGWLVRVTENPCDWPAVEYTSRQDNDYDERDLGVILTVPAGTTAKCDGKRVR